MLKHILPLIPKHRVYTEVFFGGGAVFFAKKPSEVEIINDTNASVINFYEVARTRFDELKKKIEATLFSRATYYVALTIYRMPHLFNKLQQAWAFYVGTNMGFSSCIGSWGYDRFGKRLKSFQNKTLRFNPEIIERLKNTQIECQDACKVIEVYDDTEAFHYVDPPYVVGEAKTKVDQGHYSGYSEANYEDLLKTLSNVKGKFLLSSYPSELLDRYIEKNGWHSIQIGKTITASHAKDRSRDRKKIEALTTNYPIDKN